MEAGCPWFLSEVQKRSYSSSAGCFSPSSDSIFARMRRMPILLLCVVALAALFELVGCTDGSSQAGQEAEEGQAQAAHGEEHHHGEHHEKAGGSQGHSGHEHGPAKEIEYPLSQVKSDSEGQGSSTTTLRETSVGKLFSGEPKYVNVHEAGSGGNLPILSRAYLRRAG